VGSCRSRDAILGVLGDGAARSCREVSVASGLDLKRVLNSLFLCWLRGLVVRTASPVYEQETVNAGRRGRVVHTRPYHLYMLAKDGGGEVEVGGRRFVLYSREHLDPRGGNGVSKAGRILNFLRSNGGEAFYSSELVKKLAEFGVHARDVMGNARRWEDRGLVYVRGYKTDARQSPFREGYLLTWVDGCKSRDVAVAEAVDRTERKLEGVYASSPTMTRVNRIRDMVVEHTRLRSLVGFNYIEDQLGCGHEKVRWAVVKALYLYPSIREVKMFDSFNYYYHESMHPEDLAAATEAKRLSLRLEKGRDNRVGHNWEGACDWFIDRFTSGARFWEQRHRGGKMDRRRITVHLLKSVGGRRQAAELDRVWEVTPGVFAEPITYVLSCKWGLVDKRHVDDFLEVLRWSGDFGVDTPSGREMKQGVVGVFAASAFNPRENVQVGGSRMSLAKYASLRRLRLLTGSDFNEKLRERGVLKQITVQKVCRLALNEAEVRESLDRLWRDPVGGESVLADLRERNKDLYRFEEELEGKAENKSREVGDDLDP